MITEKIVISSNMCSILSSFVQTNVVKELLFAVAVVNLLFYAQMKAQMVGAFTQPGP